MKRCEWAGSSLLEQDYHDREWGVPVHDDRLLFEFLTLEGAQAGLSWATILKKRDGYRTAFDDFDVVKIAGYDERKIEELLGNPGIVRNRLKVGSVVVNARNTMEIKNKYGSFDAYIWDFVDGEPIHNSWQSISEIPARTTMSDAMSKDLKQRGFKFTGATICYAFMQAVGMVNDHLTSCFRYKELTIRS